MDAVSTDNRFDRNWIQAGANTDEDLHFSELYRRADRELGYKNALYCYSGFDEEYYFDRCEHYSVQSRIVAYLTGSLQNMEMLVRSIVKLSTKLGDLSQDYELSASFASGDFRESVRWYRHNMMLHYQLYRHSRILEATDRIEEALTKRLDEICTSRPGAIQFDSVTLKKLADGLAFERDYQVVLRKILRQMERYPEEANSIEKILMLMPPDLRHSVESYIANWEHLYYHGYRARYYSGLQIIHDRLWRDFQELRAVSPSNRKWAENEGRHTFSQNGGARCYHEILQAVKILRRLSQLRNFRNLDRFLDRAARHNSCSEWELRCLRPYELLRYLRGDAAYLCRAQRRLPGAVVGWLDGRPFELAGDDALELREKLRATISDANRIETLKLSGRSVCPGIVTGVARVVTKPPELANLNDGEILFCKETDPDFLPFINKAAAVVTSRGGVTSHTAALCRELNKPSIVGVGDFPSWLKDGYGVVVDANTGNVHRIEDK